MDRSRAGRAALCQILAVLAFGLGACGEDAAPGATPSAPLPGPPPFEPQAVDVALGASGSTVTLMTTRTGGFTLDGEDFTGGDVNAENGNEYTLALADGQWSATFVPVVVEVTLGASGDMLTITMLEDRTYEAGGEPLMAGDTRAALNGNFYNLSMVDGEWMAMYEPALVSVELGTSGASLTLSRAEDGSHTLADGAMVVSVSLAPDGTPMGALAENGNVYSLVLVDGEWMAMFDPPDPVTVALGTSGESVSIQIGEGRGYSLDGMMIMDGHSTMASNGNEYMLSMADGEWMASYVPTEQMVTLGMSGTVITLVKAEDHSYWLGDMGIMDGSMTMSENGNTYSLTMGADGTWMAIWVQDDPVVHALGTSGATISLQRLEDRRWGRVGASGIMALSADDASGLITVTAANGNVYRLMLMDGEYGEAVFQAPRALTVALGASGESVSIQKAEDGTYWHGDMAVSGGTTLRSSDGRAYTLTYADGAWTANFDAPMIPVQLGNSGRHATLEQAEDGSYWLNAAPVVSGETTTEISDGRVYRLSIDEDGMWIGTYVPATQQVAVGSSGVDVTVVQDESGQWTFTHPLTGETVSLISGMNYAVGTRTYLASMDEDGIWTAHYVPREVMVGLGMSGESVTLVVAEDGTHWLGGDLVVSGETQTTSSLGVSYTLNMGEDGMWSAALMGNLVTVTLGSSGTTTFLLAEDGTWLHGSELVADGSVISAANGNSYRVSMDADGAWTATYLPIEMEVRGTALVAMANEDGVGYTIDGAVLPASGMGNITTSDGAMYRVHMEDGILHGARYDANQHVDSDDKYLGLSAVVDFVGDTYGTEANDANTMLRIHGEDFSVAELLGGGMSGKSGDNFVAEALKEITKVHSRALAYEALNEHLDATTYDANILALWDGDGLQAEINKIFGSAEGGDPRLDINGGENATTDADQVLENLAKLVTALTGVPEFAAATAEDGGGILEAAALSAADAMKYFDANRSESISHYRTTENTRYGAYYQQVRATANQDLMFEDATGSVEDVGDHGVFWWGLIPTASRRAQLPASGTLHYSGGTLAVGMGDNDEGPTVYEGTIDIQVSLTRNTISAIVSNLRDMDSNPLVITFFEVDHIVLPTVSSIPATLQWGDGGGTSVASGGAGESSADASTNPAMIFHRGGSWSGRASQTMQGAWRGTVLGTGSSLATAVVGDWWIAAPNAEDQNTLTGSYGAEQVDRPEPPTMPLPPLADAESIVFGTAVPNAKIENGDLMITIDPDNEAITDNSVLFTIPISTLVQGGQKTVNGTTHMSELQEYVAAQRRVLAGWIALDAAADGNERETNTGRNDIWQAIRARVLQSVFGLDDLTALPTSGTASDTVGFMAETYPGTRNADDSASLDTAADDVEALVFLDRLVAAVGSAAGWEAARLEGGIFFDDGQSAQLSRL